MRRWFKRQSTGVQTLTIAVIVVLFLALITSGDEGSEDSAASSTTPAAAADAPTNPERPPGPAADKVIAAFEQTGLPVVAPRDTTEACVSEFYGCIARVTSDSVTVVVFETVDDAKEFVEYGRDARRYGATVVSYAAARTPGHLRSQYAAVLDAVAKGGDGHAARQRVVTKQRREARRRQIARERRIAEQQAAAERAAAEATPPPAPEPEPEPEPAATPNYSGMNCTEIGHSFSVPPGSDPEHDADGDGLACESQ